MEKNSNLICLSCVKRVVEENDCGTLLVDQDELEEVMQHCYLVDMLDCETGVERAKKEE